MNSYTIIPQSNFLSQNKTVRHLRFNSCLAIASLYLVYRIVAQARISLNFGFEICDFPHSQWTDAHANDCLYTYIYLYKQDVQSGYLFIQFSLSSANEDASHFIYIHNHTPHNSMEHFSSKERLFISVKMIIMYEYESKIVIHKHNVVIEHRFSMSFAIIPQSLQM